MITRDVLLADKTWFKTGGLAAYYAEPQTAQELSDVVAYGREHHLPIFALGEGANVLISDAGVAGLVIRSNIHLLSMESESEHTALVTAGAGLSFGKLISWCLAHQLSGLEEFSGIPGTVGGCVYINIHFFHFLLSEFLVSAEVISLETGLIEMVDRAWFNFGYDYSTLHEGTYQLVSATFRLKRVSEVEAAYGRGRRDEMIRYRAWRYPAQRTCGSFFRNFFPDEVTLEVGGKKMTHVAYYLDKVGVRGEVVCGKAQVSWQHANMIVTNPGATSADVIAVARIMQQKVYDAYGIVPQPECQLIGFDAQPLLC